MRRKTLIWFISFFVTLLAFGVGHRPLICFAAKSYLSTRLPEGKGLSFSYDRACLSAKQLVLHDVMIVKKGEKTNPSFNVKIDDLTVSFKLQKFPFKFAPEIVIDHPQVTLKSGEFRKSKKKKSAYEVFNKFFFKTPLKVHAAECLLDGQVAKIDLECPKAGEKGYLKVSQQLGKAPFMMVFSKQEKQLNFDFSFHHLDVVWASTLGQFFLPSFQNDIEIANGQLSGSLGFTLSAPKQIDDVKYVLDLGECKFSHQRSGLNVSFDHFIWKKDCAIEGETNRWASYPFLADLHPCFMGKGEVKGLCANFDFYKDDRSWGMSDVSGSFHFNDLNDKFLELRGLFHHKEKGAPFDLVGEAIIDNSKIWKIMCDARFFDEEEIAASVAVTSKGAGKFIIEGEGKSLTASQLTPLQYFVGMHVPVVEKMSMEQGIFDGKVVGWIEDKKLTRCKMVELQASQVAGSFDDKRLQWKGEKILGEGEFDFSTPDFFDNAQWELKIAGGECAFQDRKIQEIELLVAMHDQYLKPSTLTCQYEEIEGRCTFEGLYSDLSINTNVLFHPEKLAELLQVQKPKGMSQPVALDLDMRLKAIDTHLDIEGSLGFLREGEKDDVIAFGWSWDLRKLMVDSFLSNLEAGWFCAEDISANTLNLPLMIWQKDFYGRGTFGIKGTFNSESLDFSIDPTDLKYESKAVDITLRKQEGKEVPSCTFSLNFEQGMWQGTIPLQNAFVEEHTFGLKFDSFTSEVDLEGTEILFQNVDALANGVHFQAEIALNFGDRDGDDREELKINTYAIDGKAQDVLVFLSHFKSFQGIDLPLSGTIQSGPGDMHLRAYIGGEEELLEWRIAFHLQDGHYPFSESFGFENLAGNLYYSAEDKRFKIEDVSGNLTLTAGNIFKSYSLNVPVLELDAQEGVLIYDCRLEAPTYEICRVVGRGIQEEKEFCLQIDKDRTRFFGAKMDIETLAFHEGSLSRAKIATQLSALDLVHHLDFLNSAGLLPIKEETLDEMRGPHVEGDLEFGFVFDKEEETFSFDAKSSSLRMGAINLDHLLVHGQKKKDSFTLDRFEAGMLKMHAKMVKEKAHWHLPDLEVFWKNSFLKSGVVTFDMEKRVLHLPLEKLHIELGEMTTLFPNIKLDWDYFKGTLLANGGLTFDFSRGWQNCVFDSELHSVIEEFGQGRLRVESPEALRISYHPQSGLSLHQVDFNFLHTRSNQLWAKCHFDRLGYKDGIFKGEGAKCIIPPEMVHFIGQTHSLPYLGYEEGRMIVLDCPIEWENQIESSFDFEFGKSFAIRGHLGEGYYWVQDKVWYLSSCSFAYEKKALVAHINTLYEEIPFDLRVDLSFHPHFTSRFMIQETCNSQQGEKALVVQTDWNENEGFFVQSIDGGVCGLEFSFHHNPKDSFSDKMALTGQLKVNVPKLSQLIPEKIRNVISEFEIGKGYELSGDLVISKTQFSESHFSGYLKGKKFQLMGSLMGTLMSEIAIYPGHIELNHFTISDSSGMFAIKSVHVMKTPHDEWELSIPEALITDFRPSLLNKIGKYPTRIKPLTIRELRAHNIRGILGNPSSFVGKGNLNFINTFKRDYHILDIPFEILGRLGLDMGLLVPVRGEIEYVVLNGRVYFTELKSSYSEGKRSQFYLSPIEQSYIDFEGNINISIKMKQYVLLKVTEPFTLSIGGTFGDPKYSLR